MSRDFLGEFGGETMADASRPAGGGAMEPKPLPYSPPVGPSNINDGRSPGLHGDNCGNCGTQGKR